MKVYCLKTDTHNSDIVWNTGVFSTPLHQFLQTGMFDWIERDQAENDTRYKQIIPYVLVKNEAGLFACYQRYGSEKRLHSLYSCGIGGHIDYPDKGLTPLQTIQNCSNGYLPEPSNELVGMEWKTRDKLALLKKELWTALTFSFNIAVS